MVNVFLYQITEATPDFTVGFTDCFAWCIYWFLDGGGGGGGVGHMSFLSPVPTPLASY